MFRSHPCLNTTNVVQQYLHIKVAAVTPVRGCGHVRRYEGIFVLESTPQELARRWNQQRGEIEGIEMPRNIRALVEAAARLHGDRKAWDFFEADEATTFTEVAESAAKAANALRAVGVRKGSVVAVMLPNSVLFLATWLGLAYLGAVIAPVNGRYTAREVEHVLRVSGATKLIVGPRHDELSGALDPSVLAHVDLLDGGDGRSGPWAASVAASDPSFAPVDDVSSSDVSSVQFTSGTSGFPKGCLLTHGSWIYSATVFANYAGHSIERFLCNQHLFYLDGQFNTLVNLYRGTTTYYCSTPSVAKFDSWLRKYRIQSAFYFDPLFAAEPQGAPEDYDLRILHIAGFNKKRHQDLQDRYPGSIVRETFGMSEYAPSLVMPLDADALNGSGSCGLPAPHTRLRIVDEQGYDVVPGATGELLVQGPGMMLGYANNPEATADCIRDGWLHTGDLFRQDEHGFFYIVGRSKDMVRRNAENVACAEVETVLRLHPGVREAAVVPVPDETVGEEIKAYIQPAGPPVDPQDIVDFCAGHLAKFKVPRYIAFVDTFPMTESARVEKKKLVYGVDDLTAGAYDAAGIKADA